MRTIGVATFLFSLVFITGCTRAVSDKSSLTIQLPDNSNNTSSSQKSQKLQISTNVTALAAPSQWGRPLPTSFSEINCFAIAIRTPEKVPAAIKCRDLYGAEQSTDYFFGLFSGRTQIDVEVPSGDDRKIQLVGFSAENTSYCADLGTSGGTLAAAHLSPPVLLATVYKNLTPGEVPVIFEIRSDLAGSDDFEECDTMPLASSTIVEVTASGMPTTATSNATSLSATVKGFNATEYAYAITSTDTTCSAFAAAPGSWYPVSATITGSLTGFSDVDIALCLLGRSASGTQLVPTKYLWRKDSSPPGTLSLSAGSAYSQSANPSFTIGNMEVGTTINIYAGTTGSPSECNNATNYVESFTATATSQNYTSSVSYPNGLIYFHAVAVDAAGNPSTCTTVSTIIDINDPDSIPQIGGVRVGIYNDLTPEFSWLPASDTGTGVAQYEIAIGSTSNPTSVVDWTPIGDVTSYRHTSLGLFSNGADYQFSVRAVDFAGRKGAYSSHTWSVYSTNPYFQQQAYFKAPFLSYSDEYGYAVAVDGDRMVVGARYEDSNAQSVLMTGAVEENSGTNSGAIYVYKRSVSGTWALEAFIKPQINGLEQNFGHSVAISGDTIAVGSPLERSASVQTSTSADTTLTQSTYGAVYTYKYDGSQWNFEYYIKPSSPNAGAQFGYAVALHRDTLVATAPYHDSGQTDSGAAFVFERSSGVWAQQKMLRQPTISASHNFGVAAAVYDGKIAISTLPSSSQTGTVEVFEGSGSNWPHVKTLRPHYSTSSDKFGYSLSMYKDRIAVGAFQEASTFTGTDASAPFPWSQSGSPNGAVFVFEKPFGTWTQTAYVKPSQYSYYQEFGYSVALYENTLVVGAPNYSGGGGGGLVYVYKIPTIGTTYPETFFTAPNANSGNNFGSSVAISNSAIAVGGSTEKNTKADVQNGTGYLTTYDPYYGSGAAWLFEAGVP